MKGRIAKKERKTSETDIIAELNIDGVGKYKIDTGIGFLDHMLELFAFWGHFDLIMKVNRGDFQVDIHHTNEDVAIVLGQVFKEALGDKEGIRRNGFASIPMENVIANVTVDISGRGSFLFTKSDTIASGVTYDKDGYTINDTEHFFDAFAKHLGMNLIIKVDSPTMSQDLHTTLEPVFKALGKALDEATQIDPRRKGIPSTKGVID